MRKPETLWVYPQRIKDWTFIWMLVLHFDQKGALLYLIYGLGLGGRKRKQQCSLQLNSYILVICVFFWILFSILVSILDFLASFQSFLEGSQRMVPACQKPDSTTLFFLPVLVFFPLKEEFITFVTDRTGLAVDASRCNSLECSQPWHLGLIWLVFNFLSCLHGLKLLLWRVIILWLCWRRRHSHLLDVI